MHFGAPDAKNGHHTFDVPRSKFYLENVYHEERVEFLRQTGALPNTKSRNVILAEETQRSEKELHLRRMHEKALKKQQAYQLHKTRNPLFAEDTVRVGFEQWQHELDGKKKEREAEERRARQAKKEKERRDATKAVTPLALSGLTRQDSMSETLKSFQRACKDMEARTSTPILFASPIKAGSTVLQGTRPPRPQSAPTTAKISGYTAGKNEMGTTRRGQRRVLPTAFAKEGQVEGPIPGNIKRTTSDGAVNNGNWKCVGTEPKPLEECGNTNNVIPPWATNKVSNEDSGQDEQQHIGGRPKSAGSHLPPHSQRLDLDCALSSLRDEMTNLKTQLRSVEARIQISDRNNPRLQAVPSPEKSKRATTQAKEAKKLPNSNREYSTQLLRKLHKKASASSLYSDDYQDPKKVFHKLSYKARKLYGYDTNSTLKHQAEAAKTDQKVSMTSTAREHLMAAA